MKVATTRVVTGSRLHFGLMNLPPAEPWPEHFASPNIPARYFGGVGMMVGEPRIEVIVSRCDDWHYAGPLKKRAKSIAPFFSNDPHKVGIVAAPPEHIGLGVGTQFSLAVGTAMTHGRMNSIEIAQRIGRGARSSIGIHGFGHGGFIVDGGKQKPEEIGELQLNVLFPDHWHVLLLTPPCDAPWFGTQERNAFGDLVGSPSRDEVMSRLVVDSIVPALRHADLATFGAAITEYNIRAGELFRPVQGNHFSHPIIGALVDKLLRHGLTGAGQSSWGPTVFAFSDEEQRIKHFLANANLPTECTHVVTRGRNHPAFVENNAATS